MERQLVSLRKEEIGKRARFANIWYRNAIDSKKSAVGASEPIVGPDVPKRHGAPAWEEALFWRLIPFEQRTPSDISPV